MSHRLWEMVVGGRLTLQQSCRDIRVQTYLQLKGFQGPKLLHVVFLH